MASSTRLSILSEAESLVQSYGFFGFSYADIATSLGIRKASIHYHYQNKESLGEALLEKQISDFETWAFHMDEKEISALEKLKGYLGRAEVYLKDGTSVSTLVMMQAEIKRLPSSLTVLIKEFGKAEHSWIKKTVALCQEEGSIDDARKPSQVALLFGSFTQGASQVGRTYGIEYYRMATAQLLQLLTKP